MAPSDEWEAWLASALPGSDGAFEPFSFYVPVEKSLPRPDGVGNWVIEGPLSDPGLDLEGEEMDMGGLKKGLSTFFSLHAPVDWDHLWERTREPKWLIGKGIGLFDRPHPNTANQVPWLRAELFRDKEVAKQAIDHMQAGGSLGYSVAGGVIRKSGTKIMEPIVTSVALTAVPVVAANTGSVQLIKSLRALRGGEVERLPVVPELLAILTPFPVVKALEAAAVAPARAGMSDVNALGIEQLTGTRGRKRRKQKVSGPVAKALSRMIGERLAARWSAISEGRSG